MSFFDLLRKKQSEIETKASMTWATLVVAVADNKANEATALRTLDELGRTVADLEAAVATVKRRRKIRERVAAGSKAEAEIVKLDRQMDESNSKFEPIQRAYEAEVETYSNTRAYWNAVQSDASQAIEELIRSATDADALSRYQSATDRQTELGQLISQLNNRLRDRQRDLTVLNPETQQKDFERVQSECDNLRQQIESTHVQQREAANATEAARLKLAETDL